MKRTGLTIWVMVMVLLTTDAAFAGIEDGLVADWPFNGNANDETGNGNDGTVYGALLTTDRFGNPNSAYSFDGINDYIRVASDSSLNVQNITMSGWVKVNDATPATHNFVLNRKMSEPGTYTLVLSSTTNEWAATIRLDGSENTIRHAYSDNVATTDWTHIAGTYDGDKLQIYVNTNLQVDIDDTDGSIDTDNPGVLLIGAHPDAASYFNGTIDDVRIYDRVLSEAEIRDLYLIPEPATILLLGLGGLALRLLRQNSGQVRSGQALLRRWRA